ncbi:MAG TPA: ferritin-like domain-containing protein [Longimicrobiales bacterium]|nr:ferritin-like domain-containing protein [Longimicrobiales bacterium]
MRMESLQDLYVHELEDLYNAEKQILQALPKMAERTEHEELRQAFEQHRRMTEEQVRRLESIFDDLGQKPSGRKCRGIEGIIEEGENLIREDVSPDVLDAALIGAAQRVEHYEIAAYGTVRTYADQLGFTEHANLLQQTLDEEGETDKRLTQIAESRVNPDAV